MNIRYTLVVLDHERNHLVGSYSARCKVGDDIYVRRQHKQTDKDSEQEVKWLSTTAGELRADQLEWLFHSKKTYNVGGQR